MLRGAALRQWREANRLREFLLVDASPLIYRLSTSLSTNSAMYKELGLIPPKRKRSRTATKTLVAAPTRGVPMKLLSRNVVTTTTTTRLESTTAEELLGVVRKETEKADAEEEDSDDDEETLARKAKFIVKKAEEWMTRTLAWRDSKYAAFALDGPNSRGRRHKLVQTFNTAASTSGGEKEERTAIPPAEFPQYKAQRQKTPNLVKRAMREFRRSCSAYPVFECAEEEADDVLATLCTRVLAAHPLNRVLIVSPDKDFFQLLPEMRPLAEPNDLARVTLLRKDFSPIYTSQRFSETHHGLCPTRFVDYLALVGDTVDNIPGIAGVGKVSAAHMLQKYGSLEAVLDRAGGKLGLGGLGYDEERDFSPRVARALVAGRETALLCKKLITLNRDLVEKLTAAGTGGGGENDRGISSASLREWNIIP